MAWFICGYKPLPSRPRFRYCAMDDFTTLIRADGGDWTETEVLGNRAIVKVRANALTLNTIAATPGFYRVPVDNLDAPLSSLSNAQASALRQQLLDMGYSDTEIRTALGNNIRTRTLRQVLDFAATRRLKPRWDDGAQAILLDGPGQPVRPIADIDRSV